MGRRWPAGKRQARQRGQRRADHRPARGAFAHQDVQARGDDDRAARQRGEIGGFAEEEHAERRRLDDLTVVHGRDYRRLAGADPRRMTRPVRASTTSVELSLRSTQIISASFVNSSLVTRHSPSSSDRLRTRLVVERAEDPAVMRPAQDEVMGPDVVRAHWPEPDARPVAKPEPALLGLILRDRQPRAPPYPLNQIGRAHV